MPFETLNINLLSNLGALSHMPQLDSSQYAGGLLLGSAQEDPDALYESVLSCRRFELLYLLVSGAARALGVSSLAAEV